MAGQIQSDNFKIGPGAYNVQDEFVRKSPRSNIKFGASKTAREDPFVIKTTQPAIGPGCYDWNKNMGHKIQNPTIPREPLNRSAVQDTKRSTFRKRGGNASIRDNFEDFSDDSEEDVDHRSV